MAHGTNQLDELITSTMSAFEKSGIVQDTIFSGDPLLALLESKGKREVKGGLDIRVNLRYAKNPNVGSYYGLDQITVAEIDTLGHAIFNWKQYQGCFTVPEIELLQNSGDATKIVDLWKEKVEVTTLSLKDDMITDLYGDGTGNSGKDLLGLRAVLSGTGVLGGIDRDLAAWWRPIIDTYTTESPTIGRIKAKIRRLRGPGGRPSKSGKVDMLIGNSNMFDYLVSLIDEKTVLQQVGGPLVELGFDSIRIAGAELTWSDNVPAGELWYISTEYLGIRVLPGRDFSYTDVIKEIQHGVDARSVYCLWAGNLTVSNCRYLGRDTGYVIP